MRWRDNLWACAGLLLLGCTERATQSTVPEGEFLIAHGNSIGHVELPSGERSYWWLDDVQVGWATRVRAFSGDSILVDDCSSACSIRILNVRTKEVTTLGSGFMPLYLKSHGVLVFYGWDDEDDQLRLYAAPVRDLGDRRVLDVSPARRRDPKWGTWELSETWVGRPVAISPDRFVYVGPDRRLWIYDIRTDQRRATRIAGCNPRVWRSASSELVCDDWERGLVWLADLGSGTMREMEALRETRVLDYDPVRDQLFVSRFRSAWLIGESGDILAYDFDEPSLERVVKAIVTFNAVWLPARR